MPLLRRRAQITTSSGYVLITRWDTTGGADDGVRLAAVRAGEFLAAEEEWAWAEDGLLDAAKGLDDDAMSVRGGWVGGLEDHPLPRWEGGWER